MERGWPSFSLTWGGSRGTQGSPIAYCQVSSPLHPPQRPPGPCCVLCNLQARAAQYPNLPTCLSREAKGWAPGDCSGDPIRSCASKSRRWNWVGGETPLLQPKGGCRVGMREGGGHHSSHQCCCVHFPPGDTTRGKHHKMPQLQGKARAHSQTVKIHHAQGKSTGDLDSICSSAQGTAGCFKYGLFPHNSS